MQKAEIFEHLPTRILAIQFTSDNIRACCRFIRPYNEKEYESKKFYELIIDDMASEAQKAKYLTVNTLEGYTIAYMDKCWIVQGTQDEFWAVENEIFKNTYYQVK